MTAKLFNKIGIKLVIITSLVLIVVLSIHTFLTIRFFRENLESLSRDGAYSASDIIKRSTRYSMLLNKKDDIHRVIKTLGNEPGIKKISIYDKTGKVAFSSDSTELNRVVDKKSEACIACHKVPGVPPPVSTTENFRTFNIGDERVMGLINPIRNESDCFTSECHFHKSDEALLGVLDVMVSMKNTDETISTATKNIVTNSILITLLISGLSGIFIFYLVNKPLSKFEKAIAELGKGNLDYKIYLRNKNEFGIIAHQFNHMSGNLSLAYKEIKDWSDTLNTKVEEKTSELKNIYEQIFQMEKLASLGKLSATVAHELNNPLEGILTYSKLISKKLKSENSGFYIKLIEYSDLIAEESARCGKIVKDLLLFSHTDTDKFISSDLVPILDKSVALINHHLEINNIKLVKEYYAESVILFCNPQKIRQAIISLLINAIESMSGREGGTVTIKLNYEFNNIVIHVSDEGTGISATDLPYIFEPFYTTKEASKGTGLGLSVVYGIINQHKGKIEVEKTSIKGTTFKISLPLNLNKDSDNENKI